MTYGYETCNPMKVSARLHYMPYAHAGWIREKESDCFTMISYSSRIFTAQVTAFGVEEISTRNADAAINYSRTTSRQVTMALRELGLTDRRIATVKKLLTNTALGVTTVRVDRSGIVAIDGTCAGCYFND